MGASQIAPNPIPIMPWNIRKRLIVGCVVLLLVITVACSYGLFQMSYAGKTIRDNAKRAAYNMERMQGAHLAKAAILSAEGCRVEFLLYRQTKSIDSMRKSIKDVRASLDAVVTGASADDSMRESVKAALANINTYEKTVTDLANLVTKRGLTPDQGVEGALRKSVHSVEELVKERGQAELTILMLMCRRHEKDYMLRGDEKYIAEIAKRIEEFTAQMKQVSLPTDVQATLTTAIKGYFAGIQALVEIDKLIKTRIADSNASSDQAITTVDAVDHELDDLITVDRNASLDVMAKGKKVMMLILIVGLCLGVILALGLVRAVCPPLESAVRQLRGFADHTSSIAAQISNSGQSLAEGASEQAASLEETSASLEEMSSMTKRNAEAVQNAKKVAGEARSVADSGIEGMKRMTDAMDGIKASSSEIAKIIKTIDEIAFQTNILALNAAVEAARAGESGAGFAVVADEVRSLAQRSAQAAKETTAKIEVALSNSEKGARASHEVATTLSEIVGQVRSMDALMGEIALATNEQTQAIGQVNSAVSQMDSVTQGNAASAEESAAAAMELSDQSNKLQTLVQELGILVGLKKTGATANAGA